MKVFVRAVCVLIWILFLSFFPSFRFFFAVNVVVVEVFLVLFQLNKAEERKPFVATVLFFSVSVDVAVFLV